MEGVIKTMEGRSGLSEGFGGQENLNCCLDYTLWSRVISYRKKLYLSYLSTYCNTHMELFYIQTSIYLGAYSSALQSRIYCMLPMEITTSSRKNSSFLP